MTSHPAPPERLAAALAARILHDISGPASGVASGLDLLAEPGQSGQHGAALDLAVSSAKALLDLIEFHKAAFGAGGESVSGATLHRLALTLFEGRRPRLEWAAELEPFPGLAAQAMLILAQVAAGALAAGGLARATAGHAGGDVVIRIYGEGPRAALHPENLEGLAGRELSRGLAGRWAPSRYLSALMNAAGGAVTATTGVGRFTLTATLLGAAGVSAA
ncbi:MAG TPA: histidine phosphotransferase family protein [Caulobacteraceae bacterium]|nr:histidine phosphotransferase family protein [Caulobacteraceae bacterium]